MGWAAIVLAGYTGIGMLMLVALTWSDRCATWREAGRHARAALAWPLVVAGAVLALLDDSAS